MARDSRVWGGIHVRASRIGGDSLVDYEVPFSTYDLWKTDVDTYKPSEEAETPPDPLEDDRRPSTGELEDDWFDDESYYEDNDDGIPHWED